MQAKRPKAWDSWASHTVVQSPRQVEIPEGMALSEATALLEQAGLRPPLLVKPLWTDGREGSHGLAVLHDMGALGRILQGSVSSDVKPPLVVQQFVEHGGVLYKVRGPQLRVHCVCHVLHVLHVAMPTKHHYVTHACEQGGVVLLCRVRHGWWRREPLCHVDVGCMCGCAGGWSACVCDMHAC